ncbi:hypothetical protein BHE74_00039763 [Ensete ventricosum]|nr:hypothetical protein BHE74_00039763 [Ensete ventricosum]
MISPASSSALDFESELEVSSRVVEGIYLSFMVVNRNRGRRKEEMVRKAKVEFDESPPDFDPNNPYGDPVAMLEYREYLVREKFIQIETAKIIRERLRWCYRIEGVNHLQKCRHLVQQYLDATRGVGWGKDSRPHELHGTLSSSLLSLCGSLLSYLGVFSDKFVFSLVRAQKGFRLGLLFVWSRSV